MNKNFEAFLSRIKDENIANIWRTHSGVKKKFFDNLYIKLSNIPKPRIVEFGVRHGTSTSMFLDICFLNNGKLYSVDCNDYSKKFNSANWHFIRAFDTDFDFLLDKLPSKNDVIFLDTIHKAEHVINIFKNYFHILKVGGYFIIDDINWVPYLKGKKHDHFFKEVNCKETFNSLIQLYNLNNDKIDIQFSFNDTGIAIINKIADGKILFNSKNISRDKSFKNLARVILKKLFQIFRQH